MFSRIFKREKPNVYLGEITVVPRSRLKQSLENGFCDGDSLEESLQVYLQEIFNLPPASMRTAPNKTDLAVDVIIANFQAGNNITIDAGDIIFPIFWRPRIEIVSKLYNLETGEITYTAFVTVKLSWAEYFSRLCTWRAFIGFRPMFDATDMRNLLARACLQLLGKLTRSL